MAKKKAKKKVTKKKTKAKSSSKVKPTGKKKSADKKPKAKKRAKPKKKVATTTTSTEAEPVKPLSDEDYTRKEDALPIVETSEAEAELDASFEDDLIDNDFDDEQYF